MSTISRQLFVLFAAFSGVLGAACDGATTEPQPSTTEARALEVEVVGARDGRSMTGTATFALNDAGSRRALDHLGPLADGLGQLEAPTSDARLEVRVRLDGDVLFERSVSAQSAPQAKALLDSFLGELHAAPAQPGGDVELRQGAWTVKSAVKSAIGTVYSWLTGGRTPSDDGPNAVAGTRA